MIEPKMAMFRIPTMKSEGLCDMQPTDAALIQLACAANQTVRENSFAESLLKNIAEENVTVVDLFQRIANEVYEKSNQ
jgi:hypothetical protein